MDDTTIKIGVDSSEVSGASKALGEFAAAGAKAESTTVRMTAAAAKAAGVFDKLGSGSRKNVLSFKDAEGAIAALGLTGSAADKLRAQLGDLGKAAVDPKQAVGVFAQLGEALGQVSLKSATARREILVLLAELARGDMKRFGASMLVFAEYANLSTFATSALGISVGVVAVAIGGLAIAAIKGAQEMHELQNALLLTNNYAGLTAGSFDELTSKVAKTNSLGIGDVRGMAQALAATGEIGPQVFSAALEATTRYAELTGQEAGKVAATFAKMADSPTKFLVEMNKTTHAFTSSQYEQVRALEEGGRSADAQAVIYDALNQRFKGLDENLGYLSGRLKFLKLDWQNFWNAAFDIGRPTTIEDKIANTTAAIERVKQKNADPITAGINNLLGRDQAAPLKEDLRSLERQQFRGTENAFAQSLQDDAQKAGIAAREWGDKLLKAAKDTQSLSKALKDADVQFKKAEESGTPYSESQKKEIRAVITRRNTRGGRGNEPQQVARATLAQQLEEANKALKDEQESIQFSQTYINEVFQQGNISIGELYAERSRLIRAGVDAELAEIDKERNAINTALNDKKSSTYEADPSTRINLQTKLNKLNQQSADITRKASQQEVLDIQKQAVARTQLQERVEAYNVQLLQAMGLEDQAANVRTNRLLQQAQIVAGQAKGEGFAFDIGALRQALQMQDQLNSLKRQSSILDSARGVVEDNINRLVANGSITELQSYSKLAEARAQVIPQLEAIVEQQEKIAKANPLNLQIQVDTARARLELESLKDALDPLAKKFQDAFKDQTGNFLFDMMTGRAKPKDAIKNLFNGIGQTISKEISNNFSQQLFAKDGLFGGAGSFVSENLFGVKKPEIGKKLGGLDTDPVQASLANLQNAGIDPTTLALQRLLSSIDATANSIGSSGNKPGTTGDASNPSGLTTGDVSRFDNGGAIPVAQTTRAQPVFTQTPTPVAGSSTLQSAGIDPTTAALQRLAAAADAAANSISGNRPAPAPASSTPGVVDNAGKPQPVEDTNVSGLTTGDLSRFDNGGLAPLEAVKVQTQPVREAIAGQEALADSAQTAATANLGTASSVIALASAASKGGNALNLIPQIIATMQSAGVGGTGGPGGFIGSLLGGTSGLSGGALQASFSQTAVGGSGFGTGLAYGLQDIGMYLASGGYTGDKGRDQVAGVVHGKEYVFSAQAVDSIGKSTLDKMHAAAKAGDVNSAMMIGMTHSSGNRELGGPVTSGNLYRVNERGPEVLTVGGNQYLMTGSKSGEVQPMMSGKGGSGGTTVHVNVTPPADGSRQTAMQWGALAGRHIANSMKRQGG